MEDANNLNGEILVTERTDLKVPFILLVGACSERGSLLSHSAVVARELGLQLLLEFQVVYLKN